MPEGLKEVIEDVEKLVESDSIGLDPQEQAAQGWDEQSQASQQGQLEPPPPPADPEVDQNTGRNWSADTAADGTALEGAAVGYADSAAGAVEQEYATRYEDPDHGTGADSLEVSPDDAPAAPPSSDE